MGERAGVTALQQLVRPVALAQQHVLSVHDALDPLLPWGGLRRGSVVRIGGRSFSAALSLSFALLARSTAEGSWAGVVGVDDIGAVSAQEVGVALEHLALVPRVPAEQWPVVTAALLDALDLVVVQPPARVRPSDARRLATRARERGSLLLALGDRWSEAVDLRMSVTGVQWLGLGEGSGHLRARRIEVVANGRGAASRERRAALWVPAPDGTPLARAAEAGSGMSRSRMRSRRVS